MDFRILSRLIKAFYIGWECLLSSHKSTRIFPSPNHSIGETIIIRDEIPIHVCAYKRSALATASKSYLGANSHLEHYLQVLLHITAQLSRFGIVL